MKITIIISFNKKIFNYNILKHIFNALISICQQILLRKEGYNLQCPANQSLTTNVCMCIFFYYKSLKETQIKHLKNVTDIHYWWGEVDMRNNFLRINGTYMIYLMENYNVLDVLLSCKKKLNQDRQLISHTGLLLENIMC